MDLYNMLRSILSASYNIRPMLFLFFKRFDDPKVFLEKMDNLNNEYMLPFEEASFNAINGIATLWADAVNSGLDAEKTESSIRLVEQYKRQPLSIIDEDFPRCREDIYATQPNFYTCNAESLKLVFNESGDIRDLDGLNSPFGLETLRSQTLLSAINSGNIRSVRRLILDYRMSKPLNLYYCSGGRNAITAAITAPVNDIRMLLVLAEAGYRFPSRSHDESGLLLREALNELETLRPSIVADSNYQEARILVLSMQAFEDFQ